MQSKIGDYLDGKTPTHPLGVQVELGEWDDDERRTYGLFAFKNGAQ